MKTHTQYSKIRYSRKRTSSKEPKETGWVKNKNKNEFVIANIPFIEPNLNIDDVVTLSEEEDDNGFRWVNHIVKRELHSKTIISYNKIEDIKNIIEKHECENFKVEIASKPKINEDGMACIASNYSKHEIENILKPISALIISHIEMI